MNYTTTNAVRGDLPYPNTGIPAVSNVTTVGTVALKVAVFSPQRAEIEIVNMGAVDVYVGFDSTVAVSGATRGRLLKASQTPASSWKSAFVSSEVWVISATAADVQVIEVTPP